MRERTRDKGRLEDIIEYSNRVSQFIQGVSLDDFSSEHLTYYAVMKNVEVVGEAAFMLTKAFKAAHPETPWKIEPREHSPKYESQRYVHRGNSRNHGTFRL